MIRSIGRLAGLVALVALLGACSEPGPAEKAGEKIDEVVEKIQHGDEGALEKAGRKVDEAIEETSRDIDEALQDASREIDEAADALKGD